MLHKKIWFKKSLWEKANNIINYPLTLVQAGLGYGKSTFIENFLEENYSNNYQIINLNKADNDVDVFCKNLLNIYCNNTDKELLTKKQIQDPKIIAKNIIKQINLKNNIHNILVLDSFENVAYNKNIREFIKVFINMMPENLHLVILSQYKLLNKQWADFYVRRQINLFKQKSFILNREEIKDYMNYHFDLYLTNKELKIIDKMTEGWILPINIMAYNLIDNNNKKILLNEKYSNLFEKYLDNTIFNRLDSNTKEFMLKTSIHQELNYKVCDKLLDINNSKEFINDLIEKHLLFNTEENTYKFNNMFRKYLIKKAKNKYDLKDLKSLHIQAAKKYKIQNNNKQCLFHYIYADKYTVASKHLMKSNCNLLSEDIDMLLNYLNDFSEEYITKNPCLLMVKGLLYFSKEAYMESINIIEEYLNYNQQCNECLLLVLFILTILYKSTMQFDKLENLKNTVRNLSVDTNIKKILTNDDMDDIKDIQKIQFKYDNYINLSPLLIIIYKLYRKGSFKKINDLLINLLNRNIDDKHVLFLLKMGLNKYHYVMGNKIKLLKNIKKVEKISQDTRLPLVNISIKLRKAYTYLWFGKGKLPMTRRLFQESYDIYCERDLLWLQVESLLGMSLLEAYYGDLNKGIDYAKKGMNIGINTNDKWSEMVFRLCLGINYYYYIKNDKAIKYLDEALEYFSSNNNHYYQAICLMWLTLIYYYTENWDKFNIHCKKLLTITKENNLDYIYTDTHLFFKKGYQFIPVLLKARDKHIHSRYIDNILEVMGFSKECNYHPGYRVYIKCFGDLEIYCGGKNITKQIWKKEKVKNLLLYLFKHRGNYIPKEKINSVLWNNMNTKRANQNFKVNLSFLKKIIEPDRNNNQSSLFIERRGSNYKLNNYDIISDVDTFLELIKLGDDIDGSEKYSFYEAALDLYKDNFLKDHLYIDWLRNTRENMKNKYLKIAEKVIKYYYENEEYDKCINLCNNIIKIDNCWENAYLYLIKSYRHKNHRSLIISTYNRCKRNLEQHLDIDPNKDIKKVYSSVI